ncbi:phage terminase large subunit [Thermus phage P74-26]|uniref:Terminase, large subunit n=1 Tax=Thermus phage P74-26 TaxID=2914007 RepID=A7XXR1_BP742|nr:phage terminase large subunit [Thermus phage P74-26]ABU97034.1 phage terminase large subunit [Thermus phage P74-26]
MKRLRPSDKFFELLGYKPHHVQLAIHRSTAKRRVACLGRQSGKSEAASVEAVFELFARPGSQGWIIAPTYDQAEIIFGRVVEKVERLAEVFPATEVQLQRRRLRLLVHHYDRPVNAPGAKRVATSEFRGKSADRPDNLRGATLDFVILDEAAMIPFSVWSEAIEPTLSVRDGWALIISTPKGLNWFYEFFLMGWRGGLKEGIPNSGINQTHPDFESFHAASWDVWPERREWYMERRLYIPDLEFRQEYGAEFVSHSNSVFSGLDMLILLPYERRGTRLVVEDYRPDHIYCIGADFGKNQDYSVFSVLDLDTGAIVCLERMNGATWSDQVARLKALSEDYGHAYVVADTWGVGDAIAEELDAQGINYTPLPVKSSSVKEQLISNLALLMEKGQVAVPNDKTILDELRNFRYYRTASGNQVMRAYGRGHDDIVMSLALAYSQYEGKDGYKFELAEERPSKLKHEESVMSLVEDDFTDLELANRAFSA